MVVWFAFGLGFRMFLLEAIFFFYFCFSFFLFFIFERETQTEDRAQGTGHALLCAGAALSGTPSGILVAREGGGQKQKPRPGTWGDRSSWDPPQTRPGWYQHVRVRPGAEGAGSR